MRSILESIAHGHGSESTVTATKTIDQNNADQRVVAIDTCARMRSTPIATFLLSILRAGTEARVRCLCESHSLSEIPQSRVVIPLYSTLIANYQSSP